MWLHANIQLKTVNKSLSQSVLFIASNMDLQTRNRLNLHLVHLGNALEMRTTQKNSLVMK